MWAHANVTEQQATDLTAAYQQFWQNAQRPDGAALFYSRSQGLVLMRGSGEPASMMGSLAVWVFRYRRADWVWIAGDPEVAA